MVLSSIGILGMLVGMERLNGDVWANSIEILYGVVIYETIMPGMLVGVIKLQLC